MTARDRIVLVPHHPAWSRAFERERKRLQRLLGARALGIEHFGSTAVPRAIAKPILDILVGVATMAVADDCLSLLCENGYDTSAEFNATLPARRFLLRRSPRGVRTHHAHLVVFDDEEWRARLRFRDRLRNDPKLLREYSALKVGLAARFVDDREGYTEAKTDFVSRALRV